VSELRFDSVEARDVSVAYGRTFALRRVSVECAAGTATGLQGPNGAGKTTLFHVLATLLRPTSGSVLYGGRPARAWPDLQVLRARIGMLGHQSLLYTDLSGEENLAFFGRLYGVGRGELGARVDHALELVGMSHARTRAVKHCSRGMVQRLAFARVLVQDPQLWLLDEPATGMDEATRDRLVAMIRDARDRGRILLVISHERAFLEAACDRILPLERGRIGAEG
jgi:ABC-type multidrug transport system ATPase subunit